MINLEKGSDLLLKQLPKGAFLTVLGERLNTMTIAWGHIGVVWNKPVFIVFVRPSRYTYEILMKAHDFTVNIPYEGALKKELAYAGSTRGEDLDKFEVMGLTPTPSKTVKTPSIKECALNYECKIIYRQIQEPALIQEEIQKKHYPQHDMHVMIYGEITHIDIKNNH